MKAGLDMVTIQQLETARQNDTSMKQAFPPVSEIWPAQHFEKLDEFHETFKEIAKELEKP